MRERACGREQLSLSPGGASLGPDSGLCAGAAARPAGFSCSIIERDARLEHRVATRVFVLLFFRLYLHFMHTCVCVLYVSRIVKILGSVAVSVSVMARRSPGHRASEQIAPFFPWQLLLALLSGCWLPASQIFCEGLYCSWWGWLVSHLSPCFPSAPVLL